MLMLRKRPLLLLPLVLSAFAPVAAIAADGQHPSVSSRVGAARSVALSLQADASTITSVARAGAVVHLSTSQTKEILQHVDTAQETARELQEIEKIASPSQKKVISHITPLLRDLARNTEAMLEHLKVGPNEVRRQVDVDYLSAHEEIAKHTATQLISAIDNPKENASTAVK